MKERFNGKSNGESNQILCSYRFLIVRGVVKVKCRQQTVRQSQLFGIQFPCFYIKEYNIDFQHFFPVVLTVLGRRKAGRRINENPIYWWERNRHRVHSTEEWWCLLCGSLRLLFILIQLEMNERRKFIFHFQPFFIRRSNDSQVNSSLFLPNADLLLLASLPLYF